MRASILCWLIVATFPLAASAGQEKPEKPAGPPKKGDAISVRGCLTGSALEATDLGSLDVTGAISSGVTFRLTGDKNLLKQMREKHDGRIVDIEGILKSDLRQENLVGRKVGKMRITIGSPAANPGTPEAEGRRSVPVLEVKSYEGSITTCGR